MTSAGCDTCRRRRALLEFPPVVAYGRLYVASNAGGLFAVQAETGRIAWRYPSGRCAAASPAVADEGVAITFLKTLPCRIEGSRSRADGEVVALDAHKGRVVWRKRIGA